MSSIQKKWQANLDKVAFMKQFPGRIVEWADCHGKTVQRVIPLENRPAFVLIMTDGTFAVVPKLDPDPADLREGLQAARTEIEKHYPEAYAELTRLVAEDRELTRRTRLENILGAIRNNVSDLPELKKEIRNLLDRLPD
jgi:hypothetical protein